MKFIQNIADSSEEPIKKMKSFYGKLVYNRHDRVFIISELKSFISEYENQISDNSNSRAYNERGSVELLTRVTSFLGEKLGRSAALSFSSIRVIEPTSRTTVQEINRGLQEMTLSIALNGQKPYSPKFNQYQEEQKQQLKYICACLEYYGLHPNIEKRLSSRYNLIVKFIDNSGKSKKTLRRYLMSKEILEKQYINLYAESKPVLINGTKISHDFINQIRITETKLLDDEIILYKRKNNFSSDDKMIESFKDVSDELLQNPNLNELELSKDLKDLVHSKFQKIVTDNFRVKQYSEAVRSVMIELIDIIKQEYKTRTGKELDGSPLMTTAFSVNKPTFILGDINTESGKNIQQGYMKMYDGAVGCIRNPVGHKNVSMDALEAYGKIIIATHLLKVFEKSL